MSSVTRDPETVLSYIGFGQPPISEHLLPLV